MMTPEEIREVAKEVASQLKAGNRDKRDEEFIKKITDSFADSLIEHKSPCHELTEEEVVNLKSFVRGRIKYARAMGLVKIGLAIFLAKELYHFLLTNLHWGGK